jgi:hypothetical protein
MPLCRRGLTNVDWLNFNGIRLGEADLDWLGTPFLEFVAYSYF